MSIYQGSRYSRSLTYRRSDGNIAIELRNRHKFNLTDAVMYTVKQGDTIDGIAYKIYGNAQLWWAIMDTNPQYSSELDINVGDVITIPTYSEVVKYCG